MFVLRAINYLHTYLLSSNDELAIYTRCFVLAVKRHDEENGDGGRDFCHLWV